MPAPDVRPGRHRLVDGTGFAFNAGYAGHIQGIPALGIPDLYLADGAVGVGNGSTGVTEFPDGTDDAATWDPGTVQAVGTADGTEQAAKGHQVSLAPNLNILRERLLRQVADVTEANARGTGSP